MILLQAHSSKALCNAMSASLQCMSKKNALSILDYALLTQKGGRFYLTTATQDSQLTIPVPLALVSGEFSTPVALPIGDISALLLSLPDCVISMKLNENNSLTLDYCLGEDAKTKSGQVSLSYMNGGDFPTLPGVHGEEKTVISLPASVFCNAIGLARVFSAKDELRLVLNSLCIDISEDKTECYLVATNGHMIMKISHNEDFFKSGSPCRINIYNAYFKVLSAFSSCEIVCIETDGQRIRFYDGDMEFVGKALDGRYPNYNAVIPKGNPYYMVFSKREMLDSIKRVRAFGSDTQLLRIKKEGMFAHVSACDNERSRHAGEQVFLDESQCVDGFEVGMNADNLINTISAIEDDVVRMQFSDPSRPCVCMANSVSGRILTLCMPMRIE